MKITSLEISLTKKLNLKMFFVISRKNDVLFLIYSVYSIWHPINIESCDIMMSISTGGRVHDRLNICSVISR